MHQWILQIVIGKNALQNNSNLTSNLPIAESVKSQKDIFMASKLALGGALKSREASNVMILPS